MNIVILGSGSWGLAVAQLLGDNGHTVNVWSFQPEITQMLKREHGNSALLPGAVLTNNIEFTDDISLCAHADIVVFATPSFAVYETALKARRYISKSCPCVLLSKGFDKEHGYCLLSKTLENVLGEDAPIVALTGPSHAEEVVRRLPTAVVAASRCRQSAEKVQSAFMNSVFRVYTTPDIVGAELGGAMKNIMALAVGVSDGVGFGDNTKALIMTRGIAEMSRFGVMLGGRAETFAGLSGIGDLIVTCISDHSRNRRAGLLIGGGLTAEEAIKQVGATVEGYFATEAIHHLSKGLDLELPISTAMYELLFNGAKMGDIVKNLTSREKKPEATHQ